MSLMFNQLLSLNINEEYNTFRYYPFMVFLGIVLGVLTSVYRLRRQNLSDDVVYTSLIFIIPSALLVASFIGKLDMKNFDITNLKSFFSKFSFWKPGLSIHGGVAGGLIASLLFFPRASKKYKISLWTYADCIIPNILLGQMIGRWGNFFNHELLGKEISDPTTGFFSWLPAFIRNNAKTDGSGPFREPIFLYESISCLLLWIFIIFILPNIFHWISKKPWKLYPEKYPLLEFNLKNMSKRWKLQQKYWNEAYYHYQPQSTADIKKTWDKTKKQGKKFLKNQVAFYKLYNPDNYFVMHAGVQTSFYFFSWNLVRFYLETKRNDSELLIINDRTLSYTILIFLSILGLIFMFLCQFVLPYLTRKPNYTYENQKTYTV